MSIDTGINGNVFAGNYFNLNQAHLKGWLRKMEFNFKKLFKDHNTLQLKPHFMQTKKDEL